MGAIDTNTATTVPEVEPGIEVPGALDADGFSVSRVRMCCGKTRYTVSGTLLAGCSLTLEDAEGQVHASDYNPTGAPRPTRLNRVMSVDDTLELRIIPPAP